MAQNRDGGLRDRDITSPARLAEAPLAHRGDGARGAGHAHYGLVEGARAAALSPLLRSRSCDPPISVFELNVHDDAQPREERAIAEETPVYAGEVTPRSSKE